MQDQSIQTHHRDRVIPLGIVATLSAVVLATGGGIAWWTWSSLTSKPGVPPQTASRVTEPRVGVPLEQTVQVYWLQEVKGHIEVKGSAVAVSKSLQPEATLREAFEKLLIGPKDPTLSSTIPQGTRLLGIRMMGDGVHVDLSKEFTQGGGSTSMAGRVAQVLYTATSLEPSQSVWISVEGKPLEVLGGEGLELEQPLTREYFEQNFDL